MAGVVIGRILAAAAVLATLAAWIAVPTAIYRSGAAAVPVFQAMVKPGPLSAKHAFLSDNCEACHAPNRGVVAAACIVCHADNQSLLGSQATSFHATIGDCRGCHVEHLGADRRPTSMQHETLVEIAQRKTKGPAPAADRIAQSASAAVARLLANVDGSAALDCAACHASKDRHLTLFGRDCGGCHATTTWSIAEFRHPSPRSTDCAQCHQAPPSHYMEHFRMVSRVVAGQMHAQVEQCFLCHQTTAWNDIKGIGWYKHH